MIIGLQRSNRLIVWPISVSAYKPTVFFRSNLRFWPFFWLRAKSEDKNDMKGTNIGRLFLKFFDHRLT